MAWSYRKGAASQIQGTPTSYLYMPIFVSWNFRRRNLSAGTGLPFITGLLNLVVVEVYVLTLNMLYNIYNPYKLAYLYCCCCREHSAFFPPLYYNQFSHVYQSGSDFTFYFTGHFDPTTLQ